MSDYRALVALRYAAESVDEVNVFLARGLEVQLRLQKQGAIDRIVGYFGGTAAALAAAFGIGGEFFTPGIVLAVFLVLMGLRAIFHLCSVENQRKEFTVDHLSVKQYLQKATRDRLENGVTVAIQNRKAAARLLQAESDLDDEERSFLEESVAFWGKRIRAFQTRIADQAPEVWKGQEAMREQIESWIAAEEQARPIVES